jgi:hypothetical protein
MKIFEVAAGLNDPAVTSDPTPNPDQLMGLVSFLSGRANDTNARKEISQDAFIQLAHSLDINVNKQNLPDITNQPPLSNILEPLQPDTDDPIVYKGGDTSSPEMPVNKAQDIVAQAAKSAAKKDRGI